MLDYEKETEGCTFEPEFYTKQYNDNHSQGIFEVGDIYERQNMWKLHKDMKIDEQRLMYDI